MDRDALLSIGVCDDTLFEPGRALVRGSAPFLTLGYDAVLISSLKHEMGHRYPKRSQLKYTKQQYRVRNWREYESGLRGRGELTLGASRIGDTSETWRPYRLSMSSSGSSSAGVKSNTRA